MGTSSYEKRKKLVRQNEMKLYRRIFDYIEKFLQGSEKKGSENLRYIMDVCVKF